MSSWFRAQVKDHGLIAATILASRVVRYRIPVVLSNKFLPANKECPCCGWTGRRFLDYIEPGYRIRNTACPNCDSHSRHRALFHFLKNDFRIEEQRGRALIFAPERSLAPLWQAAPELRIIKTDLEPARGVDILSDVMRLPFSSESMELIWCHHVLEQVEDDGMAMRELHRVLKTNGELIISAGSSGQDSTIELGHANKNLSGNRRFYGRDFAERLVEAGFKAVPMSYNLTREKLERYGVFAETFYYCTIAT